MHSRQPVDSEVSHARQVARSMLDGEQRSVVNDAVARFRTWVIERDPEAFERAEEFVIDRTRNRHAAFGLGIHRCVGSNLARLELTVALEEWMRRIPDFELTEPDGVVWSAGQIRGPRQLPVRVLRTEEVR